MNATVKTENNLNSNVLDRAITGVSQVALGLIITVGGLTGLWACACLISVMAKNGGVVGMAKSWFGAVVGM